MIIGKEDKQYVRRLENILSRLANCHRWLSEITELDPMWDYILGKKIVHITDNGKELEVMAEGDVSNMREKLRARFK